MTPVSGVLGAAADLLRRHQEERRMVRMKDCDAVYDTTLNIETQVFLQSLEAPNTGEASNVR